MRAACHAGRPRSLPPTQLSTTVLNRAAAGVCAAMVAVSSVLRELSMIRGCCVGYVGVVVSTGSVSVPLVSLPVLPVPSSPPAEPDGLELVMEPVHGTAKNNPHERTMAWFRCICARDSSCVRGGRGGGGPAGRGGGGRGGARRAG